MSLRKKTLPGSPHFWSPTMVTRRRMKRLKSFCPQVAGTAGLLSLDIAGQTHGRLGEPTKHEAFQSNKLDYYPWIKINQFPNFWSVCFGWAWILKTLPLITTLKRRSEPGGDAGKNEAEIVRSTSDSLDFKIRLWNPFLIAFSTLEGRTPFQRKWNGRQMVDFWEREDGTSDSYALHEFCKVFPMGQIRW